ncbi:MAG: hypothetical protein ACE5G9_02745 [Nitrospinales bacterium]
MFYKVRILDSQGKVEKVIDEKELSKRYWKVFNDPLSPTGKGKPGRKSKKKRS